MNFSENSRNAEGRERLEGIRRLEITVKIDDLFRQMEGESDQAIRENIGSQIEEALKRGRQFFEKLGKSGKEEIQEYYRRLRQMETKSL